MKSSIATLKANGFGPLEGERIGRWGREGGTLVFVSQRSIALRKQKHKLQDFAAGVAQPNGEAECLQGSEMMRASEAIPEL